MISIQESRMRGLFLHGLTSLMGEVVRGVIKSNSRMKESVLFHEKEEEKKLTAARGEHTKLKKQMETRDKKAKEVIEKSKEVIAHLKKELEGREKKIKENEEKSKGEIAHLKKELEGREKKIKENEEKSKEEVAHLKKELEQISVDRDKFRADKDHVEGQLKVKSDRLKRKESENLEMKGKVDQVQKKLENKEEVIGKLQNTNAGLNRALDFNADVNEERGALDAKVEKANLEARNWKRSREDFEGDVGPELKKVHAAVSHLRNGDVDTGLKMLDASEKQIAPALALSKNQKRHLRRTKGKKEGNDGLEGNKYL